MSLPLYTTIKGTVSPRLPRVCLFTYSATFPSYLNLSHSPSTTTTIRHCQLVKHSVTSESQSFSLLFFGVGWNGNESTITEATTGLLYQHLMMDDDECKAVGGIIGRGNRSTRRRPAPVQLCPPQIPQFALSTTNPTIRFVHHKSHITRPNLEPGPPRWKVQVTIFHSQIFIHRDFRSVRLSTRRVT
jgi:hypothetical protein